MNRLICFLVGLLTGAVAVTAVEMIGDNSGDCEDRPRLPLKIKAENEADVKLVD